MSNLNNFNRKVSKLNDTCKTIFEGVSIVNMENGLIQSNKRVIVVNNKITEIVECSDVDLKKANVINCHGKYMIPGLWDMHIHLLDNIDFAVPNLLANGVTGVRDMGSSFNHWTQWENYVNKKNLPIHIIKAGLIIESKFPNWNPPFRMLISTKEEVEEKIEKTIYNGSDFLKVHNMVNHEVYCRLMEEAKLKNYTVSGHVPYAISAFEASEYGQNSVEHLSGLALAISAQEEEIRKNCVNMGTCLKTEMLELKAFETEDTEKSQKLMESYRQNNVWQVPTLVIKRSLTNKVLNNEDQRYKYFPKGVQDNWNNFKKMCAVDENLKAAIEVFNKIYDYNKKSVKRLHDHHIGIMAGTDANCMVKGEPFSVMYGWSLHDELFEMVDAGLTPLEALQTATINPVEYLKLSDELGSIEKDKIADFLVLEQNPLEDIKNITTIKYVVLNGRVLNKDEILDMIEI